MSWSVVVKLNYTFLPGYHRRQLFIIILIIGPRGFVLVTLPRGRSGPRAQEKNEEDDVLGAGLTCVVWFCPLHHRIASHHRHHHHPHHHHHHHYFYKNHNRVQLASSWTWAWEEKKKTGFVLLLLLLLAGFNQTRLTHLPPLEKLIVPIENTIKYYLAISYYCLFTTLLVKTMRIRPWRWGRDNKKTKSKKNLSLSLVGGVSLVGY